MSDIAKLDKNFQVDTSVERDNIKFYNVDASPFKVYGVYRDGDKYVRMPESVAREVNPTVAILYAKTAGGRVRFKTNSAYVAIHAVIDRPDKMPHMAFSGSIGFDLYVGDDYYKTFMPRTDTVGQWSSIVELDTREMREITVNFPLYCYVCELYIGLEADADVSEGKPYANEKPLVYYGSSITQGACASRPGTCYQNIISRRFNYDYINLGFSGSARAEDVMVDYLKSLDMSIFVCDYDHNAPDPEYLEATHEKMFKAIRAAHPSLPVIFMSRPRYKLIDSDKRRLEIIRKTYENALAAGDTNVYLIDNTQLTALCGGEGLVDGTHPTDFGFASMAKAVGDVIENIEIEKN